MAYSIPSETPWSAVTKFLEHCQFRDLAASTTYNYWALLRRFSEFIAPTNPEDATSSDIERFMRRSPAAANTRRVEHARFGGFFGWVQVEYGRTDNPVSLIARPRRRRTLPRPVGEADLSIAIELADPFLAAALTLAAYAGLRASEIAKLRGENILLSQRLLIVHGKGGHCAALPLHDKIVQRITTWGLPTQGWVFPHHADPCRHIEEPNVSKRAATYLRSIGIDATLHQLRHRFATAVYQTSGKDIRTTQELMRHRSPDTTAIYAWVDPADGQDAVNALP